MQPACLDAAALTLSSDSSSFTCPKVLGLISQVIHTAKMPLAPRSPCHMAVSCRNSGACAPTQPRAKLHRSPLPTRVRICGGPLAILCSTCVNIPLLLLNVFGLWSSQGISGSVNQSPVAQYQSRADTHVMGSILGTLEALRVDLRRQETRMAASDAAMGSRVARLESAQMQGSSGGALPMQALATDIQQTDSCANPVECPGIDWAAFSAGGEIDRAFTSSGLGRSPAGRISRGVAWLLPRFRAYIGNVSHPPEVALASDSAPPSKCFCFEGTQGTIAVRLLRAVRITHVVIEQRPQWATVLPRAAPRSFQVHGMPAENSVNEVSSYTLSLGEFEYQMDGPRTQVFLLSVSAMHQQVQAVKFTFLQNWGEDHTSVCRVRVLGPVDA